ncbi:dihydroorotase [Coemansia erecta]|nr:dihydroorotase [Coemansia erecta]
MASNNTPETLTLPWASDFHCHLRQGAMMETVTPMVTQGGVKTVLAMPNLTPPLTKTHMAVEYGQQLQKLAPDVHFILTLYLNPDLTPEEIKKAAGAGITAWGDDKQRLGSSGLQGVLPDICGDGGAQHGAVPARRVSFGCEQGDLHSERRGAVPGDPARAARVVPQIAHCARARDHQGRGGLRKSLGDTVACTITAHHLFITVDDWAGQPHHFCKPVAKFPSDRDALQEVAKSGHPRFFLGSDSAPHPRKAKQGEKPAAGVFTTPVLVPLVATLFEKLGCLDKLEGFISTNGRNFYQLPQPGPADGTITLTRSAGLQVPASYAVHGSAAGADSEPDTVVPFMAGSELFWSIKSD